MASDRHCSFGKCRPEAAAGSTKCSESFVERIGKASRRRSDRERRELNPHQLVEALDDANGRIAQLAAFDRTEVRFMRDAVHRRRWKSDLLEDEIRNDFGEGRAAGLCLEVCHDSQYGNRNNEYTHIEPDQYLDRIERSRWKSLGVGDSDFVGVPEACY
jgi:hypothetical protein